jgi:cytochrome c oxidase subunit 3
MSAEPAVTEPFTDAAQQRETAQLGMWLFLTTETMMFGSLLVAIWYYRAMHPEAVARTVERLHYGLAGFNSVLLLTSCLAVSLAVGAARAGQEPQVRGLLFAAAALATAFLGVKGYEYFSEYREHLLPGQDSPLTEPASRLFINLYVIATALHGVHVLVGIGLALGLCLRLWRGRMRVPARAISVEVFSYYWHLVDVIWIFLYPSLYLVGRPA